MRLGIIGGLGRVEPRFQRIAAEAGHEVVFHDGDLGGRGAVALEHLVERAELVVLVTDVNSHGAVRLARRLLKERQRSALLLRRCGLATFATLISALDRRREVSSLERP
jgi:hypothetical protein